MSNTNKQDMIEYLIEFDRTFGGPLSHLFELEKTSKYNGMSTCELKNLCYTTDYYIRYGEKVVGERLATKLAEDLGAPSCKYRKIV